MKKSILALTSLYPVPMDALSTDYNVIKIAPEQSIMDVIKDNASEIAAIIALPGKLVTSEMMDACPNLEIISNFAVGTDNIDLKAAAERNIIVTNTPEVLTADTADIALSLLLAISRRVSEGDRFVRAGQWGKAPFPLSSSLAGKTCGIVGLGRIGQAIAKRASAFDMNIVYYGRSEKENLPYVFYSDLNKMAQESDYLVLSCAGGPKTQHLVNRQVMEHLGESGFVINVSRGTVVEEDALLDLLKHKKLAGAGLDVYENEPSINQDFFALDNVVLMPHVGSATIETRTVMAELVINNVKACLQGNKVLTPVAI
jgi:lactate dehydrogenase-like 2-hydroxyacid dehydrogenase